MATSQSFYVIFEGIDGAGKSSQIKRLAQFLKGRSAHEGELLELFEPTGGPFGQEIRRRAREGPAMSAAEELELFLRDRGEHVDKVLTPALSAGHTILQDRSFYSTVAYQGSCPELGKSLSELLALNDFAPRPDLVVLLDIPAELGLERIESRGQADAFEKIERQREVRKNFLSLADESFLIVDGSKAAFEIAQQIQSRVEEVLRGREL